jgi:hypothetical protein
MLTPVYEHSKRHCEICHFEVERSGPWCELYCHPKELCWSLTHDFLLEASACGDGPMVNAMCEYGRSRWPACLHW